MTTVLLTGASGFVGVHTVQALLEAGHQVRALVRTPSRLTDHLAPLGVAHDQVEVTQGDMTDEAAVRRAVEGCDAVVHGAATFSFRRSDTDRMTRENAAGTRTVLQAGADAGCSPLVHVSSTVALLRPGGGRLDHTSPLGTAAGPYSASKIASERVAREMQDSGAPVTIVNPGGVLGPHDPYLGETNRLWQMILKGRIPAWPRGCLKYVDVRDVAAVLTGAVGAEPGGRYLVPGHDEATPYPTLREITGRRLPVAPAPAWLARLLGEDVRLFLYANRTDDAHTTQQLGVSARPFGTTARDTVRWLAEAGHISRKQAGDALA